jgi:hypothetical protein
MANEIPEAPQIAKEESNARTGAESTPLLMVSLLWLFGISCRNERKRVSRGGKAQGRSPQQVWIPYSCAMSARDLQGRVAVGTGRCGGRRKTQ